MTPVITPSAPSVDVYAYVPLIAAVARSWAALSAPWTDERIVRDWLAATPSQRELYARCAHAPDTYVRTIDITNDSILIPSDTVLSGVYASSVARWVRMGIHMNADRLVQSRTVTGPRKGPADYAQYMMRGSIAERVRFLAAASR